MEYIPSSRAPAQPCFICGRSFVDGDGRFCSSNCPVAFDDGFPPYEASVIDYGMKPRGRGFLIDCAKCRRPFESRGLRCCSNNCERDLRQKQELDVELAGHPFREIKRKCADADCNGDNRRCTLEPSRSQAQRREKQGAAEMPIWHHGSAGTCDQTTCTSIPISRKRRRTRWSAGFDDFHSIQVSSWRSPSCPARRAGLWRA
jgi:hypothetical protein